MWIAIILFHVTPHNCSLLWSLEETPGDCCGQTEFIFLPPAPYSSVTSLQFPLNLFLSVTGEKNPRKLQSCFIYYHGFSFIIVQFYNNLRIMLIYFLSPAINYFYYYFVTLLLPKFIFIQCKQTDLFYHLSGHSFYPQGHGRLLLKKSVPYHAYLFLSVLCSLSPLQCFSFLSI